MTTRHLFEQEITKQSNIKNINGYVLNNSENLIDDVDIETFQKDLTQGSGNELKSKFNALYSSSALVVNNSFIKRIFPNIVFLGIQVL